MVDLIDETFVVAPAARVAALVRDPARWRAWWPDFATQGVPGPRRCRGAMDRHWPALSGSTELWIEPWGDG